MMKLSNNSSQPLGENISEAIMNAFKKPSDVLPKEGEEAKEAWVDPGTPLKNEVLNLQNEQRSAEAVSSGQAQLNSPQPPTER